MPRKLLKKLEKKIRVIFKNKKIPISAITHPSFQNSQLDQNSVLNFQRLEFLGDSVLNFFIAKKLYNLFPEANEGLMSRLRSTLVSRKLLAHIAEDLKLMSYLRVEKRTDGAFEVAREKILADAFEALVAAVYLDRGQKSVEAFLQKLFEKHLNAKKLIRFDPNPKSMLQEYVQKKLHILPSYQNGPRHKERFAAWVSIQGKKKTKGEGRTVREAEAAAAMNLLKKLKVKSAVELAFSQKETAPKN